MFSVICSLKLLHFYTCYVSLHYKINYVLFFFHFFKGMRWQCTMNMLSLYFPTSGKETVCKIGFWFMCVCAKCGVGGGGGSVEAILSTLWWGERGGMLTGFSALAGSFFN